MTKRQTGRHRGLPLRMAYSVDDGGWMNPRLSEGDSNFENGPVGAGFHACPRIPMTKRQKGRHRGLPLRMAWLFHDGNFINLPARESAATLPYTEVLRWFLHGNKTKGRALRALSKQCRSRAAGSHPQGAAILKTTSGWSRAYLQTEFIP